MAMAQRPDTPEDEERFVAALRRRDERAFNRFVLTHQDRVYNLCLRLLGSPEEARDVAQEVFVTVFQKIDRYRGDARLSTWLYRVASNHAKNRIKYLARRHDRAKDSFDDLLSPPSEGRLSAAIARPDQALEGRRAEAFIQRALLLLDPDQREAVVLRDIEGLSYEEVSDIVCASLGTVKSRIHRGRARLKEALDAWVEGRDVTVDSREAEPPEAPAPPHLLPRLLEEGAL
ncbi:MAG: sigma-70 family RNA polymerase sigma factor [Deltaproteobacteria bacterium]|nr:sigma-70 family RNA polymerase sigma factor [Deltaproteobacteria bacterium]